MRYVFAALSVLSLVLWLTTRVVIAIHFEQNLSGHLKRAADANTIEIAIQEMEMIIGYLDNNELTNGYTSVLYRTPDEDIGFWYQNLSASLKELKEVKPDASQLEKSNILMKLRETLLDSGKEGQSTTEPCGISIYPNNGLFLFWAWISLVATIISFFWVAVLD